MTGRIEEYLEIFDVLAAADAKLKIVIAGNHDITLDEEFYNEIGQTMFHRSRPENLSKVRDLWTGERAMEAGIVYLEEGTKKFQLKNGAELTVDPLNRPPLKIPCFFHSEGATDLCVSVAARILYVGF